MFIISATQGIRFAIRDRGVINGLRYLANYLFMNFLGVGPAVVGLSASNLKHKSKNLKTSSSLFDFSAKWSYLGVSITPMQKKLEIESLMNLIKGRNVKSMLEIGTADGGTLFLLSRAASPEANIISIDLPSKNGGYPEWRKPLYNAFSTGEQKITLLKANSKDKKTIHAVSKRLDGRKLDLLFIDCDHTYSGVKRDFENYFKLVKKGGLIAFHDIARHPPNTGCQVEDFWDEIKGDYKHLEIIQDKDQKEKGIGVLERA